jgi:hypothetical protein
LAAAGDINGDAIADLLIGGPGTDANGKSYAGATYVLFGKPGIGSHGFFELSWLNGSNGFVVNGIKEQDISGSVVSGNEDVDGDGFPDIIIGAPEATPINHYQAGQAYVVFGGPGIGASGSVELADLDGDNGFTMNGTYKRGLGGGAVSRIGDFNGDGYDDVLVGAEWADPGRPLMRSSLHRLWSTRSETPQNLTLTALDGSNSVV